MAKPSAFKGISIYKTPMIEIGRDGKPTGQFTRQWQQQFQQAAAQFTSPVGTEAPATSNAPGIQGQIQTDGDFLYICVNSNQWKRLALNNF